MLAPMARLAKNILVTSKPVCSFPNGDYFYVQLSRTNGHYDCFVKMACAGDPEKSVVVAKAQGKTIREAESNIYERAIRRFPRFPRPPYLHRGSGASRTVLKTASNEGVIVRSSNLLPAGGESEPLKVGVQLGAFDVLANNKR
jgi:hypothetical protein